MLVTMFFGMILAFAEGTANDSGKEKSSVVIRSGAEQARPQRVPANVDLVLIVGDEEVTILFRGDFGIGTYQLADVTFGGSVSNEVNAYFGYSEVVPFSVNEFSSLEFSIIFEDGSWCQVVF